MIVGIAHWEEKRNEEIVTTMRNAMSIWLTFTVLISLFIFLGSKSSLAQQGAESRAIFAVK